MVAKKTDAPIQFPSALLALVKFAAKPDGNRFNLERINVEVDAKGVCTLAATNGHALAFVELEGKHGPERSFGIRYDVAVSALKHRPKGKISVTPESLSFDGLKGYGRIAFNYEAADYTYPDWRKAIENEGKDDKIAAFGPAYLKLAAELGARFSKSTPMLIVDRLSNRGPNRFRIEEPADGLASVEFILMPMRSGDVEEAIGK